MTTTEPEAPPAGDGDGQFDVISQDMPPLTSLFAVTVPAAMKVTGSVTNHVGMPPVLYYATVDVRRPIPEAKTAAVKALLTTEGFTYALCYGGNGGNYRDARGFRIQFKTAKTEAQMNTFLAAAETAATA